MKKLVYTLLIALSSYCFVRGDCYLVIDYDHRRKMTKDVNVWTHRVTPWSIDLKKDSTYGFFKEHTEGCHIFDQTYFEIYYDNTWMKVWEIDWEYAKNNSVEV